MIFNAPTAMPALALLAVSALAGCMASETTDLPLAYSTPPPVASDPRYDTLFDGGETISRIPEELLKPENRRQEIDYSGSEEPGTIVIDPDAQYLYLVQEGGRALRYRVGVGKAGYAFEGEATVARKADWPRWTPTRGMIEREPDRYGPHSDGVEGGVKNPLGARALYLYKNGKDTLYRIHGTNDPSSIGRSVSAGCIRMYNQDVIDLESRVPKGSRVVVKPSANGVAA
jgi:lipoprotein-anchoring transpeptidase ErfK/SrfK